MFVAFFLESCEKPLFCKKFVYRTKPDFIFVLYFCDNIFLSFYKFILNFQKFISPDKVKIIRRKIRSQRNICCSFCLFYNLQLLFDTFGFQSVSTPDVDFVACSYRQVIVILRVTRNLHTPKLLHG